MAAEGPRAGGQPQQTLSYQEQYLFWKTLGQHGPVRINCVIGWVTTNGSKGKQIQETIQYEIQIEDIQSLCSQSRVEAFQIVREPRHRY